MNLTYEFIERPHLMLAQEDKSGSPNADATFTERLIAIPSLPFSNQAYLAGKAWSSSWNDQHYFQEGSEVKPKLLRCYFSAIDLLISKLRVASAFAGAVFGKREEHMRTAAVYQGTQTQFLSCIQKQRTRVLTNDASRCIATYLKMGTDKDSDAAVLVQGKEHDDTQFILMTSSKIAHIQKISWKGSSSYDALFLPLILPCAKEAQANYSSWEFSKEHTLKKLNAMQERASRKVVSVERLPHWCLGLWLHVHLQFFKPPRPIHVHESTGFDALRGTIDYCISSPGSTIIDYGVQFHALRDLQAPLRNVKSLSTTPNSLFTHCKINALGLAAFISGPIKVYESAQDPPLTTYSEFLSGLDAHSEWIENSAKGERAALVLFNLKAAVLKGRELQTSIYGSHLFVILLTGQKNDEGKIATGYNLFGSYLYKYRLRELGKAWTGKTTKPLNRYKFRTLVLDHLRTILNGREWTEEHDDSYHQLFASRNPAMISHAFCQDLETKRPIASMPFKAHFIPFKTNNREEIRKEFAEWQQMNHFIPLHIRSLRTFECLYPQMLAPHIFDYE